MMKRTTSRRPPAAQRRRPRRGCARTPASTYLYLHAVGVGNSVAVPCLARHGAKRGTGTCDPLINTCRHALCRGFWKSKYTHTNTKTSRSGRPICFFAAEYPHVLFRQGDGGGVCEISFVERKYGRINGGTRVLELAADTREATPWQGAR
jgi:hypothetical protein